MSKPCVAIIGLGLIGGSIGLALKASAKAIHIIGCDIDPAQSRLARKMGAVDESTTNLLNACKNADLVVIATPITAIRETLELIGSDLKQGCVVTDTATLKEPVLTWATETLPAGISFVGGDPLLNPQTQPTDLTALEGLELARADLFQGALYALCVPPDTPITGVKRVTDVVNLIQARPFYVDPTEHDGIRAAVEGLPTLTGLALMQNAGESPGWQEARKLADHVLGMATASLGSDAATQSAQLVLNADHLVSRLDALIHGLEHLRELIATKNDTALKEAFDQAASTRARWLADRAEGEWGEELGEIDIQGTFSFLGSALGRGSSRRRPKEK